MKSLAIIVLLLISGCANHYHVDMDYSSRKRGVDLECPVNVVFVDQRKKKTAYKKTVSSVEAEEWMLGAMKQWGRISPAALQENLLEIEFRLHRAYIHHAATSQSAVVALTAIIDGDENYYRGRSTDVLWWGAEWEFADEFNSALDDLKPDLIEDIVRICDEKIIHNETLLSKF